MSTTLVYARYVPTTYWLNPVIKAVSENAALAVPWASWREHRLADLGFAIETRRGNLAELVRMFDRSVNTLGKQLEAAQPEARIGEAYPFDDQEALRLALVSGGCFVAESRSCFENLADFNNEFCQHFFGDSGMNKASSYAAISSLVGNSPWIGDLQKLRHDIMHYRAPWFAFNVVSVNPLSIEPVLLLEWRPELHVAGDYITIDTMRAIRSGLGTAVDALGTSLEQRARSAT
ncbi:MAG: hypothetical protein ACREMY_34280 [bacterium]